MNKQPLDELPKSAVPSRDQLENVLREVDNKLRFGLNTTHISYILLLSLITWLNFQLPENGIALWLFKIVPLIIFIPGFIKRYHRAYSWLCFAVLPYFIWIIPLALGRNLWSDWTIAALIVIIFIAAMMSSRWMQRQSYLQWQIANTPVTRSPL